MLSAGEHAALQYSGGKDSTALLHLARPHLPRITVYFGDTGASFPHVKAHVVETCARLGARLVVVAPPMDIRQYHAEIGLPSDVVPVEASLEMRDYLREKPPQLVQSYMRCCAAMLWMPMEKRIRADGHTIILRGSKVADARVGVAPGHVGDGVEYRSPLWEWSDDEVMAYLDREGASLPAHYSAVPDSLDCHLCTAHLGHHGAAKLRWMREHTPELWPETRQRLQALRGALARDAARTADAFMEAC
jgi:3'-phosphoadenosine 5'-phosphosulfate sulfotransferase (PAPS reductase)/FAD synthetase